MKKVLAIGLAMLLLLCFSGCAGKNASPALSHEFQASELNDDGGIEVGAPGAAGQSYGLDKPAFQKLLDGFSEGESNPGLRYLSPQVESVSSGKSTAVEWSGESRGTVAGSTVDQSARLIVRTGTIEMVVDEIAGSLAGIKQIASRYGGYVVHLEQWKEGDRNIGNISIRVLASDYENALADLRMMAKSITNESSSSQDVTEEYTDLDAQIKNLQITETQLHKIMETAAQTEDILAIQRELTDVRGKIEQTQGRMLYLERTSSTSLINIRLEEAVLALKFSADRISAGTVETIIFNAEVIGGFAPYNYFWDFGDGHTSFEPNPRHQYKAAGVYPVGLKVTDDKGYTNTVVRNSYINIVSSWKPGSVARNAWSGFVTFGKGFVNVLIWLAAFSPVWIVAGAAVWYFVFFRRRKKKNPW